LLTGIARSFVCDDTDSDRIPALEARGEVGAKSKDGAPLSHRLVSRWQRAEAGRVDDITVAPRVCSPT
jgi:hypothetical protein